MARKTSLWELRPWTPYINTSDDPSLLKPPACVNIENRITGVNSAVRKRPGIDKDWDDQTPGDYAIVGGADFWYPSGGLKLQAKVSVRSDGTVLSYDPDEGTSSIVTNSGSALSAISVATNVTFNGKLLLAMDGSTNYPKKYSGTGNLEDLRSFWDHTTISRASSGTTRTIVLGESFKGVSGDKAVIADMGSADYNGTFTVTSVATTTVDDDTIVYEASTPLEESTTADTAGVVDGLAPNGSIISTHQMRVLITDKNKNYRLHYSETGQHEVWGGYGDSGVLDFDPGDNDPIGITGVFPTFNGDLFVAKQTKLYRVRGYLGYHTIETVSSAIGCISHESIAAVDKRDIIWCSTKGIHSLAATEKYGDYEEAFISKEIQKSFNEDWTESRKRYLKGRYFPKENLYLLCVTEEELAGTKNNCVWVYHTDMGKWISRDPNISCESIFIAQDPEGERPYFGSSTGKLYQAFTTDKFDTTEEGARQAIQIYTKTGRIHVTDNPFQTIGFKKFVLYYQPKGTQTIVVTAKVDKLTSQSIAFTETGGGTPLGASFILGTSLLGSDGLSAPYTKDLEGYGRYVEITIQESSQLGDFTVTGLGIEYQPMGVYHELNNAS